MAQNKKWRPIRVQLPSTNPQGGDYETVITDIYDILRKLTNSIEVISGSVIAISGGMGTAMCDCVSGLVESVGTTTDPPIMDDDFGTIQAMLRNMNRVLSDIWIPAEHRIRVTTDPFVPQAGWRSWSARIRRVG